jgi:hypothetical protein
MCLACEQQGYFFRMWCADFTARGEMPPGVTAEDLEALDLPLPKASNAKADRCASAGSGSAFACDAPSE